jgi:hypothetical protein
VRPTGSAGIAFGKGYELILNGFAFHSLVLGENHLDNKAAALMETYSSFIAGNAPSV